ncbi:MAG: alcohol dehydrogenase catalytic domain-containing protein, partial [Actinomycetes bacterium]
MRATVIREGGIVSLETVPDPKLPGPNGAIVTVEKSAICGSDLHILHGAMGGEAIRPGHEVIGTIAELGPEVRNFRVGDRVLVSGVIGCGWCGP